MMRRSLPLALMLLVAGCGTVLMKAVKRNDMAKVTELVESGVDVNEKKSWDDTGANSDSTALHAAAHFGRVGMVRYLIEQGADVNATSGANYTPLHNAAWTGQVRVTKMLLEAGADPWMTDSSGDTPAEEARRSGHKEVERILRAAMGEEEAAAPAQAPPEERHAALEETPRPSGPGTSPKPAPRAVRSDVDVLPAGGSRRRENAYAVVIGIENYRERLPAVDFAASDAELVAKYLTKAMGFPEENVVTLLNERAAKSDLEKYLEQWLENNVEAGGTVFVYYSGHGAPSHKTREAFLVPYDGDPTYINKTGYALPRLYRTLAKLPADEVVVMLDSCFSGAGGRSVIAKGARPLVMVVTEPESLGKNIAVLSAASGTQISSTYDPKGHGLFTYFLLKGLQGKADLDEDGAVEIGELHGYLRPNVERVARKLYNTEQTPQLRVPKGRRFLLTR
ncbi:MAG: ankyrin repeat domain-containing protein [Elusimicrobiota bacterium]